LLSHDTSRVRELQRDNTQFRYFPRHAPPLPMKLGRFEPRADRLPNLTG
jgi:hypothetical protein